ncbi:MAG: serine protein kinase RIO [Chloroflexi bacterium]|nr:serine protein kinase RIO [Chloroflexota bacterium]
MDSDSFIPALDPLIADGHIRELLYQVKSGKEATIYCCRAGARVGDRLVAAKVYKPRHLRSFRNDSAYQEGRVILDRRARRAAAKRTEFGREVQATLWTGHELETLRQLHAAGADVPVPLAGTSGAVLMEWIGDADDDPAPQLKDVVLQPDEAQALFERLLENVALWLACNVVHGDLSAYNLLYQPGRLVAIDFPQASDPRFNPNACALLARDLEHVCQVFARYGVEASAEALTADLWERFSRAAF